jgi:hypothetical protein
MRHLTMAVVVAAACLVACNQKSKRHVPELSLPTTIEVPFCDAATLLLAEERSR